MPILSAYNLTKSFAGKTLFQNINFGIDEKERVGLIGPNGAGKSTLLKILAQQTSPDEGQVTYKKGLRVGYLEQDPKFSSTETIISALLSKTSDPHESMASAYEWMARLELTSFGDDYLVSKLSGGWQKRVALARELVLDPELMLLDEPTNHLDISSILWLEEYLKSAPFSLLMITHDRLFLQRVVNRMIDLDPKNPDYLLSVQGDYLQYLETKEQLLSAQRKKEQVLKNTLRRETEWLRRGAIARQTKQKARIESAHSLADEVSYLERKNRDRTIGIDFGESDRNPKKLIEAHGISKTYGDQNLFKSLSLLITPKTRLALLGNNGSGKTTLIKVLLGLTPPDEGEVKITDGVKYTYFEQNRETLNPRQSVLKNICPEGDYVNFRGQHIFARSYLERFLFFGATADLPVERLSGGEKARLRIAQMMLQEAQVLILDEPTNDLDIETLAVLEQALGEFNGAVILVTHDRYFMDAVCDEVLAFHQNKDGSKTIQKFSGYLQYESWLGTQEANSPSPKRSETTTASENKSAGKTKVKLSYKEKFELENMEATLMAKEEKLAALQNEINHPEVVSNSSRLVELSQEISKLQAEVDALYSRWAELESKSQGQ